MLEFLIGLFAGLAAAGSVWLWSELLVVVILLAVLVENRQGTWATVSFVASLALLDFIFKVPVLALARHNPLGLVELAVVYLAAAAAFSLFKWILYVRSRLRAYNDFKAEFLEDNSAKTLTPELASKLMKKLDDSYYRRVDISPEPPKAKDHKADIIRWMAYWPFSLLGTFLNDFAREIWIRIYEFTSKTYDRIAASMFQFAQADIQLAKTAEKSKPLTKEAH